MKKNQCRQINYKNLIFFFLEAAASDFVKNIIKQSIKKQWLTRR